MKSWKSPPKRILYVCGTSSFLMLVKSMTTLTTEVLLLQFRNHGDLFVYVYLCKRKNKTFIDCNLFCRNNTWGICTFIIIVESTVKTAKNTTTNCLNCNIQTSEDEKVKIVCYSPKKRTNLLQAKYKEWNACPRKAFHVMLNHSTKFQRMPKLHLQKQASRLTKNSHLSCTKLKNVSALTSMKLLTEKSKWWRNLKTRPLLCMTKKTICFKEFLKCNNSL